MANDPALIVSPGSARGDLRSRLLVLALAPLQPVLKHIVQKLAMQSPEILERLGQHCASVFVIDPVDLPFALVLHPEKSDPILRACLRGNLPDHDARIAGGLLHLVRLIDSQEDGDAMFFSRELTISGDTEAVVTLRNALDDVEGSVASRVADLFGAPGQAALSLLRRAGGWPSRQGEHA
ncbi:MAG: sterol-binding protein [Hyphomicrobiales bacterium]|nr:MAG: sterol-binding protein [Hyphomicrobiales bacterium]